MNRSRLRANSAVLMTRDVRAAAAFWTSVLGFEVVDMFDDPPGFALLRRGSAYQMLALLKDDAANVIRHTQRDGLMDAYFWVDDAQAEHAAILALGGVPAAPLERQPYGVLEFMVLDPEGHHIAFGQDLSGEIGQAPN